MEAKRDTEGTRAATRALHTYLRARYPVVYVVSAEEQRVERAILGIAAAMEPPMAVLFWSCTHGFQGPNGEDRGGDVRDPIAALQKVLENKTRSILVMRDMHQYFEASPTVVRLVRDLSHELRLSAGDEARTVILLSPIYRLPEELDKEVTVVRWPLPTRDDIEAVIDECLASLDGDVRTSTETELAANRPQVVDAALGLTVEEIGNVIARSIVQKKKLDPLLIASEKEQIVSKGGVLEWVKVDGNLDQLGGYEELKGWLRERRRGFSPEARAYGLPNNKGMLVVGYPGVGKSLAAKLTAGEFGMPCLRFDPGRAKGKYVGESEAHTRGALQTADTIAPCVFLIDEVDKGAMARRSGGGEEDGGTTAQMYATVLTWAAERRDDSPPVFVVMTANRLDRIDTAFTRKGRLDEIWWVGLPDEAERASILRVHLLKRKRDPQTLAIDVERVAKEAPHFTGAELEAGVIAAMYRAFGDGKREVTTFDLMSAVREMKCMFESSADEMKEIEAAARGLARYASRAAAPAAGKGRKIEV